MYSCKYCGKEFESEYSVSRHISGCKEYYIQRDGDLSKYYEKVDKLRQFYANKRKQKEQEKLVEIESREPYVCENCGRTVEESVNSTSKYGPRRLCVDHNHETKQFRGVLCPRCNSFLGWYEKFKTNIETYLNNADGRSASQSAS